MLLVEYEYVTNYSRLCQQWRRGKRAGRQAEVLMRICIVGGGIVGLALARLVGEEHPSVEVVVLEKEADVGQHQTSRNSGVVHAGLYYEPGSLKARLCRRGMGLLKTFCSERQIAYDECGKVVVALDESEMAPLLALHDRAVANGVPDVKILDGAQLRLIEPHAAGIAALHSPHTAIVDYAAVAAELAKSVKAAGGEVRLGATVVSVRDADRGACVELADDTRISADAVIVCAGLQTDLLARASGRDEDLRVVPFRGEYLELVAARRHLCRGLIYPVPDPALPFLGVHVTKRIDGSVLIGPNAVLALAREGYRRSDFVAADVADMLRWSGTWRLMSRYWRTGAAEAARSASRTLFVHEARRYLPDLRVRDVVAAPAGVRAQAVTASGRLVDDFDVVGGRRVTWVRNAPSPAATSSLAIAEELLSRIQTPRSLP